MPKEENKKFEPKCACGKEDLYEVWLQEENRKKEQAIQKEKDAVEVISKTNPKK